MDLSDEIRHVPLAWDKAILFCGSQSKLAPSITKTTRFSNIV